MTRATIETHLEELRDAAEGVAKALRAVDNATEDLELVATAGLLGAMWLQEAKIALHEAVAKITAAGEVVAQAMDARPTGPGLYVPG